MDIFLHVEVEFINTACRDNIKTKPVHIPILTLNVCVDSLYIDKALPCMFHSVQHVGTYLGLS